MPDRPRFAVSLMCMDFLRVESQLKALDPLADMLHADVMDGHFCKNLTLSPDLIRVFKGASKLPLDAHLMVEKPNDWALERVAEAGADIISPHAETINVDAFRTMNRLEALKVKRGVVLNPATPLESVQSYLGRIDLLTIMTVDVGFAGQPIILEMMRKIEQAAAWKAKYGYTYTLQVDGGCYGRNMALMRAAGAEQFVLGRVGFFEYGPDAARDYALAMANFAEVTGEQVH